MSSGGIGISVVLLRAYKAQLASKVEVERLRSSNSASEDSHEQIRDLETQVHRLTERVEFTERLLGDGRSTEAEPEP